MVTKKPILSAKYCSSEVLSARLARHVQAGNHGDIDNSIDLLIMTREKKLLSDKMMIVVTSHFPKAASMFLYNASETPVGQFE